MANIDVYIPDLCCDNELSITTANTGIIRGGELTINGGDPTKIDIAAGSGYIIDDTVAPPTATLVTWSAFSAVTLTNLATKNSTDIAINIGGAVVQQDSYTNSELRTVIFIGGVDHTGGVVRNTFSVQVPAFAAGLSVRDLARAIGDLNLSGNVFGAAASNLTLTKNAGTSFSFGRNTENDKTNPHIIGQGSIATVSFSYIFRNGTGGTTVGGLVTDVNPLNFDNGTGTLATVGVNDYAYQQFLLFPNSNNVFIQYGSTTFNTMKAAIENLSTTTFPDLPGFGSAMRRGVLIVKRGTTNLTTVADARFFVADKYGSVAGSVGAGVAVPGVKNSIEIDAGDLQLVGDTAAPGNVKLYGTNGAGARGWYDQYRPVQVTGLTLVAASWTLVSGLYEYDLADAGIAATSIVDVIPGNADIAIVEVAEMLPRTDSSAGEVKIYAKNLPTDDIGVTINIFGT